MYLNHTIGIECRDANYSRLYDDDDIPHIRNSRANGIQHVIPSFFFTHPVVAGTDVELPASVYSPLPVKRELFASVVS